MTMSKCSIIDRITSCPRSERRSTEMICLLRAIVAAYSDFPSTLAPSSRMASPSRLSTLMTSAPKSASSRAQNGPDAVEPSSRTRCPTRGPSPANSSSGLSGFFICMQANLGTEGIDSGQLPALDELQDSRGAVRNRQRPDVTRQLLESEFAAEAYSPMNAHRECDRPLACVHCIPLGKRGKAIGPLA